MAQIRGWGLLSPPAREDEEDDRLARVIHWNALGFVVLMLVYTVVSALARRPAELFIAYGLMIAVGVATLAMLRHMRPRAAGAFFCLSMWVLIQFGIYSSGGIQSTGMTAYILLVLTAGFFWSGTAAAALAIASSLATMPFALGWVDAIEVPHTPMRTWGSLTVTLGMTWVVLVGPLASLRRSVSAAREHARNAERLLREHQRVEASERALRQNLERVRRLEAVGRLAGGVAHDYNNYLMVMMTHLSLLERKVGKDELADLNQAVERAAKLTTQLLSFARREPTEPTRIDFAAVLSSMEPLLRQLCGEAADLAVVVDGEGFEVLADESQLEQVLLNLTANARDAMPEGGRVTIRCGVETFAEDAVLPPRGRCVSLTVRDNGLGMAPEVLHHVFEPFFSTKGERGTGLGLATVHRIVTDASGRVEVESAVGEGTTFTVLWPLASSGGSPAGASQGG